MGRDIVGQLNSLADKDFFSLVVAQTGQYSLDFTPDQCSAVELFQIKCL